MKSVVRLILLGVSILVLSALLVYQHIQLEATKQTVRAQQETLYDLQGEFREQDLVTLNGKTVSSAEAISLARKYRTKLNVMKDGVTLSSDMAATRGVFGTNSNWVVSIKLNANDICTGIDFQSPNGVAQEPASVADAKVSLSSVVGGSGSDTWNSLILKVEKFVETENYRQHLAQMLGFGTSGKWDQIIELLDNKFGGTSSTSVVDCEKFTLTAGESHQFQLTSPTFCYYVTDSEVGFIDLSKGTCDYYGNAESAAVLVNLANKTISNDKNASVTCILFSV